MPYRRVEQHSSQHAVNEEWAILGLQRKLAPSMITGKTTILVVEDEALVRMAIAISLEEAGFAVLEASNYDGAMAMLTENPSVAAMFTDVDMLPGYSGIELAKVVRRLWPPIKILVTSGHRHIHDKDLPFAGRFVDKPYDAAWVITSLREMMLTT